MDREQYIHDIRKSLMAGKLTLILDADAKEYFPPIKQGLGSSDIIATQERIEWFAHMNGFTCYYDHDRRGYMINPCNPNTTNQ
jgi:hypothetical protein